MLRENMLPGLVVRRSTMGVSPSTKYTEDLEKKYKYEERKSEIHPYIFNDGQKGDILGHNNKIEDFCVTKK